jgi:hypothetical protein
MSTVHPGWARLTRYPESVIPCPRCSSPRSHKAHNWRWDEDAGSWLCTRPSCMERGRTITRLPLYGVVKQ